MKRLLTIFLLTIFIATIGCGSDGGSDENGNYPVIKTRDFQSPEEYLENPSIQGAIAGSDAIIYLGTTPPTLAGDYGITGTVINSNLPQIVGRTISSDVCLYNQTSTGLIDYTETTSEMSVTTFGNYITGTNNSFTIWQEGDGQIYDCQQHNAIIISGTRLPNGDLQVKTLTINLEKQNCEAYTVPEWFETDCHFSLEGVQKIITLYPTADTYVSSASPSVNYGGENLIATGNHNGISDSDLYGFVKFDLSEIPDNATIVNATLWMAAAFNNTPTKPTGTTRVFPIIAYYNWSEYGLTYNNMPSFYLASSSREVTFDTGNLYDWNVKSAVDYWINNENYGLCIDTNNINVGGLYDEDGCYFYSREINQATRLVITYEE